MVVVAHLRRVGDCRYYLKKYIPTKQISLITIDPISMKNCTSSKFMMGFLTGILPDFLKDRRVKAPSDISRSQYRQIASSVSDWTKCYQLQFQYLHSGPLGAASRNIKLPIDQGFFGNAHADIVKEGAIKNEFRKIIAKVWKMIFKH